MKGCRTIQQEKIRKSLAGVNVRTKGIKFKAQMSFWPPLECRQRYGFMWSPILRDGVEGRVTVTREYRIFSMYNASTRLQVQNCGVSSSMRP